MPTFFSKEKMNASLWNNDKDLANSICPNHTMKKKNSLNILNLISTKCKNINEMKNY